MSASEAVLHDEPVRPELCLAGGVTLRIDNGAVTDLPAAWISGLGPA
jgi:hypothetical protein